MAKEISKAELIEYYITNNHSYEELKSKLGVSYWRVDCILREYGVKKDRKASGSAQRGLATKAAKYGSSDAYTKAMLAKRKETLARKWGSFEEYRRHLSEKVRSSWDAKSDEEKAEHVATVISHGGGWNRSTIKKTLFEKYGVDNVSNIKEAKQRQLEATRKSNLERYGVEWNCQLPQCLNAVGAKGMHTKPNEDFHALLLSRFAPEEIQREFNIEGKRYDFRVGDFLIEVNPTITHNATCSPFGDLPSRDYHKSKTELASAHGYKCVHVFDWDDPMKVIGLVEQRKRVYARECQVKEIGKAESDAFLDANHIQGSARDKVRVALFHEGEIVSVMTFGKPRYNRTVEWELIRYCSTRNVIGGAERLFAFFLAGYSPASVISYCDKSKFSGDVYRKLGFTFKGTHIGKHWYNMKTHRHITDNLLRQRGFDALFMTSYGKGTSNERLMLEHGFVEVYDAGQATYVWRRG